MRRSKMNVVIAIAVATLFSVQPALAQDPANALLVEAIRAERASQSAGTAPEARLESLREVLSMLDRLVDEHPSSDLAVKLITGQQIGTLDVDALRAEVASIESDLAAALAEASKPLLERMPPRPGGEEAVLSCRQDFDCRLPVMFHFLKSNARVIAGPSRREILGSLAMAFHVTQSDSDFGIVISEMNLPARGFYDDNVDELWPFFAAVARSEGPLAAATLMRRVDEGVSQDVKQSWRRGLVQSIGAYQLNNGTAAAEALLDAMVEAGFEPGSAAEDLAAAKARADDWVTKDALDTVQLGVEGAPNFFYATRTLRSADHPRLREALRSAVEAAMAPGGSVEPQTINWLVELGETDRAVEVMPAAIEAIGDYDLFPMALAALASGDRDLMRVTGALILPRTLTGEDSYVDGLRSNAGLGTSVDLIRAGVLSLAMIRE